jgi:hypothetical protein
MKIQIKHGEIQEEKRFDDENRSVLDDPEHGNNREKELNIKKDTEVFGDAATSAVECMPYHKPDD